MLVIIVRIKLKEPKRFIDEILDSHNLNLKQLSYKLKTNYSNLKQYRRGEKTFSRNVFDILMKISPNREFWIDNKEELDDNWGGIKGGLASAKIDIENRLIHARSFRKIPVVDIKLDEFFCEFYGIILGDGCISRYKDWENKERYCICISCNKLLDSDFLKCLRDRLKTEYGIYSYYYEYKDKNICTLTIKNKNLCLQLNQEYGVSIGLKYDTIHLSQKILALPWGLKKFVLRGLFDTDGCTLANKREKYRYPWVIITSKSERFRNQIIAMLKEQGYPAYGTGKDVCVRGIANVKKWFSDIGSSNSRNLKKYEYFLKHGNLPARLL